MSQLTVTWIPPAEIVSVLELSVMFIERNKVRRHGESNDPSLTSTLVFIFFTNYLILMVFSCTCPLAFTLAKAHSWSCEAKVMYGSVACRITVYSSKVTT